MTTIAVPTRGVAGEVLAMAVPGAAVPTGTTTSLACYVQKGSDVTWQWGLNNDNSYYVLNGKWIATPYTGLTKFVTNTSQAELVGEDVYGDGLQLLFRLAEAMTQGMTAAQRATDGEKPPHAELTAVACLMMLERVNYLLCAEVKMPMDEMNDRLAAIIYAAFRS